MAKEINEKTFELNITNELLNFSRSFIWYLHKSPLSHLLSENIWIKFMQQNVLFAEGLTQKKESKIGGGYDVSINIKNPFLTEKRLMILQFKSGLRKKYNLTNKKSQFFVKKKSGDFIEFSLNDAAKKNQHYLLTKLATSSKIQSESVLYVFPRITEMTDFNSKIGSLIYNTSFVPVLEINKQGLQQKPQVIITRGSIHKYRTSYDSKLSEVNLLLILLIYDNSTVPNILSELICIQIERLIRIVEKEKEELLKTVLNILSDLISRFLKNEGERYPFVFSIHSINSYIENVSKRINSKKSIPSAPSKYTTILPSEGLILDFNGNIDLSSIKYQIF